MYIPHHFRESRPEEIQRIIEANPLGVMVTNGTSGLDAEHIPFHYEPEGAAGILYAHVARANPVLDSARSGDPVLVVFNGPDAYVSPNWYPSKHELHRQVPTWNYQVVHVHGKLWFHDDEKFLRGVVGRLTRHHEQHAGNEKPWKMGDSQPEFINQMIAAIVGVEIRIDRIEAKSKLNQNKERRDRDNAANELRQQGDTGMADAMDGVSSLRG